MDDCRRSRLATIRPQPGIYYQRLAVPASVDSSSQICVGAVLRPDPLRRAAESAGRRERWAALLPEKSGPWPKNLPHFEGRQHPNPKRLFNLSSVLRQFVFHGQERIAF